MTHPLTDDMLKQIQSENPTRIYGTEAVLAAYDLGRDEQLEQVIEWLDEHLFSLINSAYWGEWQHINALESHLKEAMRPTTTTQEDN